MMRLHFLFFLYASGLFLKVFHRYIVAASCRKIPSVLHLAGSYPTYKPLTECITNHLPHTRNLFAVTTIFPFTSFFVLYCLCHWLFLWPTKSACGGSLTVQWSHRSHQPFLPSCLPTRRWAHHIVSFSLHIFSVLFSHLNEYRSQNLVKEKYWD